MSKTLPAAACLLMLAGAAQAQNDFSKVEIKATHVAANVWELEGAGGNIGVSSGPDGLLIVDDQYAPLADKIKAALKGIGADRKLAFVINTHWHGDHTGGNAAFGMEATIVAHDNVRKRLAEKQVSPSRTVEASPKAALPVVTYADGVTLWFNGEEIRVLHLPHGHTDGDSVVVFKGSNVVHMGDLFFNGRFPFVDVDSGGDVQGYVKNVADMITKIPPGAKIIPGHGTVTDLDGLKAFHATLVKSIDVVKQNIAKGMSLEAAKKAGLPDELKPYTSDAARVERWVETVYKAYTK